ncbi:MAG TPA: threonine/serine dehydratase [Bryobacteraceae bacterium]|nr:threonine/serine dehydratase [Bryobacteraceae bacterium]
MELPLSKVQMARALLARYLTPTRLVAASSISHLKGTNVWLKLEGELPTGSFKPRGALYALHARLQRSAIKGVVASSTGNHGAAVAYAAERFGIPAFIFLPRNSNPVKRARIASLGAKIFEEGLDLTGAYRAAATFVEAQGLYFLNDATDPDLPAGPATIACEILEAVPQTGSIYVPMGDTALVRGLAAAAKQISPKVRIIGVQAERAPSYYLSWRKGGVIATEDCQTIADGLATRTPDAANVEAIRESVDDVRLVSDEEMLSAVRHLLFEEHLVAEPSGAAATAALLQDHGPFPRQVVLIVSGANVAPEVLRRAIVTK